MNYCENCGAWIGKYHKEIECLREVIERLSIVQERTEDNWIATDDEIEILVNIIKILKEK